MPRVLERDGFVVRVLLPPREHGPAHVHIYKGDGMMVIDLPDQHRPLRIRSVTAHMRGRDIVAAFRLIEEHVDLCLEQWRRYHG